MERLTNCGDAMDERQWAIKDILELGEIDHLRELVQAERDGRLVVLPCEVGDIVWTTFFGGVTSMEIQYFGTNRCGTFACGPISMPIKYFGKTVFLTREAAERALKAREEEIVDG